MIPKGIRHVFIGCCLSHNYNYSTSESMLYAMHDNFECKHLRAKTDNHFDYCDSENNRTLYGKKKPSVIISNLNALSRD